jgi:hypothetical protein
MVDYYDDPYLEDDLDEMFNNWYEVEVESTIKELSRQLRTFLNYKAEVIRYRFRSSLTPPHNREDSAFFTQKQELYSFASKFIQTLKQIKNNAQSLEVGIQNLAMGFEDTRLKQLITITRKLFILIHQFSEENIGDHPRLLHFIVKLAREACVVKMCLNLSLGEYYEELELNYECLEDELEDLVPEKYSREKSNRKEAIKEPVRL